MNVRRADRDGAPARPEGLQLPDHGAVRPERCALGDRWKVRRHLLLALGACHHRDGDMGVSALMRRWTHA